MRTGGLLLATALVCAGVAACDGGGGGSGAVPDHACDMLTTDEASDLLGVPANEPAEDTDRSGGTFCRWSSKDSGFDPDASDEDERPQYYVAVEDETGAEAVQGFEGSKLGAEEEGELENVDGLGDDAFFGFNGLRVRHGDRVFTTFAGGNRKHPLNNRQEKEIERRAAEFVIARLGDAENQDVAEEAGECARTQRCSGTRESACLLQEAEVGRITGYPVERFDGTARPTESETAAVCTYYLEPLDPDVGGVAGRVEVRFEPDADSADAEYRRLLREFPESDRRLLPELGTDAYFHLVFGEVVVPTNDVLVRVSYELDDASDADLPAIDAAAVELTKVVLAELDQS